MDFMVLRTSSWETVWKEERGEPVKGVSGGQGCEGRVSRLVRRVWILSEKKLEKTEGSSSLLHGVVGRGESLHVPRSSVIVE